MAWIKDDKTYDKWSLRAVFAGAAAGIIGVTSLAIGAFAAPAIMPAAAVMLAAGVGLEAGAIAHGFHRMAVASAKSDSDRGTLRVVFGAAATSVGTLGAWMTTGFIAPATGLALAPVAAPVIFGGIAVAGGAFLLNMYRAMRPA